MAEYRCEIKIISRIENGMPKSSLASAAYRSGGTLHDNSINETFSYTNKKNVVRSEILLPDNAEASADFLKDRQTLWNAVEKIEKRIDSQLYREFLITLPTELSDDENWLIAMKFAKYLTAQGMIADISMHTPPLWKRNSEGKILTKLNESGHEERIPVTDTEGNIIKNKHIHIMCPMRSIDKNGKFLPKQITKNILDNDGNKIPVYKKDRNGNLQYDESGNPIQKRDKKNARIWKHESVFTNGWGQKNPDLVKEWRKYAEECINERLNAAGKLEQVDCRSYIERIEEISKNIVNLIQKAGIENENTTISELQPSGELDQNNKSRAEGINVRSSRSIPNDRIPYKRKSNDEGEYENRNNIFNPKSGGSRQKSDGNREDVSDRIIKIERQLRELEIGIRYTKSAISSRDRIFSNVGDKPEGHICESRKEQVARHDSINKIINEINDFIGLNQKFNLENSLKYLENISSLKCKIYHAKEDLNNYIINKRNDLKSQYASIIDDEILKSKVYLTYTRKEKEFNAVKTYFNSVEKDYNDLCKTTGKNEARFNYTKKELENTLKTLNECRHDYEYAKDRLNYAKKNIKNKYDAIIAKELSADNNTLELLQNIYEKLDKNIENIKHEVLEQSNSMISKRNLSKKQQYYVQHMIINKISSSSLSSYNSVNLSIDSIINLISIAEKQLNEPLPIIAIRDSDLDLYMDWNLMSDIEKSEFLHKKAMNYFSKN